ncbi:MAG TPA: Tim44/TimA family putative adaptor protein [Sphingomonas sp.]
MPTIIILACFALFAGLRLYAVLGRRTGHEQQPIVKPAEGALVVRASTDLLTDRTAAQATAAGTMIEPDAVDGIRAIVGTDPRFDVSTFLDGARSAYRVVLEAFWRGDETTLAKLAEDEVLATFREAIAARVAAGETIENKLVAIERAVIDSAGVTGQMALITVRFDADIAAVTRNAEGEMIGGSLTDAVQTHDLWTFSRHLRTDDPNWILIETDEAA